MQTLAVDTISAVWVSTAERLILRESQKLSRKFGGSSAPALCTNPAVNVMSARTTKEFIDSKAGGENQA